MYSTLRECLLAHIEENRPEADISTSPSALEELCNMTNLARLPDIQRDADADKVHTRVTK
ncbi:hypothetical protein IscW_ISCW009576 [Ixodes scapularis]|uniref:Uncharacterized protein n=1 Tax=Ixodes scapularis TaxID=6945 RepID=B7Q2U3_IXOSC|nr:hypothetical protein IscW_ISCW009576 [Ixodes scapularis]|eukprot:XP_002411029.1 hypothetical protein IscW_ISCW009576 [Ixodes scapularis]